MRLYVCTIVVFLNILGCARESSLVKVESIEQYNYMAYKCIMGEGKNAHSRRGYFYCDNKGPEDGDSMFNN